MNRAWRLGVVLVLLLAYGAELYAAPAIAVLDFELNDLTLKPRTAEELARTASIAPLLRRALVGQQGYRVVSIDPAHYAAANAGFGYLFEHTDSAAALGRAHGAEWLVVGRVHKPSFLFVYLKARLIEVARERLAGDYSVEIKGDLSKLNARGAQRLAEQIGTAIKTRKDP
ncbi:MAG: DUF2380 domain-containing protein [Gammaproteobacteria bacterium]